jgi:hypothetical protein
MYHRKNNTRGIRCALVEMRRRVCCEAGAGGGWCRGRGLGMRILEKGLCAKVGCVEDSQALSVGREEDGTRTNLAGPSSLSPWIILGCDGRIAAEAMIAGVIGGTRWRR